MTCKCDRCGYVTDRLSNYKKHLERVIKCKDILKCNKTPDELLEAIQDKRNDFTFDCCFCEKKFKTSQNLYQHKNHCKMKSEIEKDNEIKRLNEELKKFQEHNNINITINQNINFIVNNFGSEDKQFLDKCMLSLKNGITDIIEKIYYDKDKPENHTVFMKSVKRNTVIVHDSGDWKIKAINEVVPSMVKKSSNILSTHLESNPIIDQEDEKHASYIRKQDYFGSIALQKKPEFYEVSTAVKGMLENYYK